MVIDIIFEARFVEERLVEYFVSELKEKCFQMELCVFANSWGPDEIALVSLDCLSSTEF